MEVWVRSQDKRSFMIIEHISAEEIIVPNSRKTIWCVTANFGCIGEYPTKERCLEIIDEIQKLLYSDFIIVRNCAVDESVAEYLKPTKAIAYQADNKSPSIEYHEKNVVVYEMPKE